MKTETKTNILSEDFEIPVTNQELSEVIEDSIFIYDSMIKGRSASVKFRSAINLLIDEYNDRRNMKIYVHLR